MSHNRTLPVNTYKKYKILTNSESKESTYRLLYWQYLKIDIMKTLHALCTLGKQKLNKYILNTYSCANK